MPWNEILLKELITTTRNLFSLFIFQEKRNLRNPFSRDDGSIGKMMIIQTVFYKQPRRVKGELLYAQICMHIIKEIQVILYSIKGKGQLAICYS